MNQMISLAPKGPFSLAASIRFLEGFTPASYRRLSGIAASTAEPDGVLRLAFPVEGDWRPVAVEVRQRPDGVVRAEVAGEAERGPVRDQLARILSLDVDGTGLADVAARDPVVADLIERYPGLRPVCFNSPYEAACWAVIGHRLRIVQAASIKARISEEHGERVKLGNQHMDAFPPPRALLRLQEIRGLPDVKVNRLHGIARAALDGQLAAARLRTLDPAEAREQLQQLSGVGPFSADLILIRGAGAPDCFPASERRLHDSMAAAYGLVDPLPDELARIAAKWRPYRSWVALLFRTDRERTTGEISRGRRVRIAQPHAPRAAPRAAAPGTRST